MSVIQTEVLLPAQSSAASEYHEAPLTTQLPIVDVLADLWRRRWWLLRIAVAALLAGFLLSFLVPSKYESTTDLMPPDQQLVSSTSLLSLMGGGAAAFSPMAAAGGLLSQKTPGSVALGVLGSRTVQDRIIDRFDLRHVYREKYEENARKKLTSRTTLNEDKKTGIISISVEDRDRYRARDMANAYVQELSTLVNQLSTSSARRERIFLEQRLAGVKADLDASSRALSQFSSKNGTFDPARQVQATAEAASRVQGELIAAEAELSSLRTSFTDDNVRVRAAKARIAELQGQLNRINGKAGVSAEAAPASDGSAMPSIRQLPLLGYTYYDLYRKVTVEEALYETLTKQYELAKVQEAKEIPPIKVLDPANVAEKRSSPLRSLYAIGLMLLCTLGAMLWRTATICWASWDDTDPLKLAARRFSAAVNDPSGQRQR